VLSQYSDNKCSIMCSILNYSMLCISLLDSFWFAPIQLHVFESYLCRAFGTFESKEISEALYPFSSIGEVGRCSVSNVDCHVITSGLVFDVTEGLGGISSPIISIGTSTSTLSWRILKLHMLYMHSKVQTVSPLRSLHLFKYLFLVNFWVERNEQAGHHLAYERTAD
jgi:hypothetical protein